MTFWQYINIIRARYRVVLYTLVCTVALTMVVSLVLPKTYSATTSMLVDVKSVDPVAGVALGVALPPLILQSYIATQMEIMSSDKVTRKVVKALQLDKDPELRQKWESSAEGRGDFEMWIGEMLRKKLEIKPAKESNVINISYSTSDSKLAATVPNAYAQAYMETDLDLKVEPAKKSAAWFDERTKAVREKLNKAQARLSEFQRQKGIVATEENLDVENARLNQLSNELTVVQGHLAESDSRQRQTGGATGQLPEVIQSPLVQGLRADLARQEAKLKESGAQLGPNHPQYQRLEAEVKALRERVSLEMAQVAGSIGTANRANQQREAQIRAAYEAQKAKVLALKKQRDEASLLIRDVEGAKREYDLILQRLAQTNLESQATQTNITILNEASEPLLPSSPKLHLNLGLSIFAGTVLGLVLASMLERTDRRVRELSDLADMVNLPVLAVVGRGQGVAAVPRLPMINDLPRLPGVSSGATS